MIILRGTFEIIYTGLRRMIGSPQDYSKNREANSFPTNYELAIPIEETHQRILREGPLNDSDVDLEDALDGLGDIDL